MTLDSLPAESQEDIQAFLLAIADDDFLMGDRLMTRWLSQGPTLEEDTAMASIAQDEMGHARLWYEVVAAQRDETVDDLAFGRPPATRRNTVLVERPFGDYADTVVRSAIYHAAERVLLAAMSDGDVEALASRADVALNEETYHREHAAMWLDRLPASEEGRRRVERAIEPNARAAADTFAFDSEVAATLTAQGVLGADVDSLREAWAGRISDQLGGLPVDATPEEIRSWLESEPDPNGRAGEHTDALDEITRTHQAGLAGRP